LEVFVRSFTKQKPAAGQLFFSSFDHEKLTDPTAGSQTTQGILLIASTDEVR